MHSDPANPSGLLGALELGSAANSTCELARDGEMIWQSMQEKGWTGIEGLTSAGRAWYEVPRTCGKGIERPVGEKSHRKGEGGRSARPRRPFCLRLVSSGGTRASHSTQLACPSL